MGLDGAGKTVALYQMKMGESIDSVPTVGGVIEEQIKYNKMTFNIAEIGGNKMMHQLWKQYLSTADIVLWVIDASDLERIKQSKRELHQVDEILTQLSRLALLGILINKTDIPNALDLWCIIDELDLEDLHFKAQYIQSTSAKTSNEELWTMIDWLYIHLPKLKKFKGK